MRFHLFDRCRRAAVILGCCVSLPVILQRAAVAQTPVPSPSAMTGLSPDAIRAKIQASGLSPDQIRSKLASMGYNPQLLDAYLNAGGDSVATSNGADAAAAMKALGFADTTATAPDLRPTPQPPTAEERAEGLKVFGVDVFTRGTSEFQPVTTAALPSTYQLGPGDEIVLVITGQVELAYTLDVTREGFIVIPQVGQVWVNGLSIAQLRETLRDRLSRVYSGIRPGANAPTHFDVSIARTRTNQIYITGDVARPGAYSVSPLASVLNALYQAGGPTANGSFRDVRVLRAGRTIASLDVYRYLLSGDNLADVHLEPGDVLFVPVHGTHVAVHGAVNRPAIFELRPDETIADAVRFAGGLTAIANANRARIERIVPEQQRGEPGVDRVVLDVNIAAALRNPSLAPKLQPGDDITVFAVREDVRHSVTIVGSVWREGTFAYTPGMRAWDLIRQANGLLPDAYTASAELSRIDRTTGGRELVRFPLDTVQGGRGAANPQLQEDDEIRVLSRFDSTTSLPVEVAGAVAEPHSEHFRAGTTLRDAILLAGGLQSTSDPEVEIARLATPEQRSHQQNAQIYKVRVDSTFFLSDNALKNYLGDRSRLARGADSTDRVVLVPGDRILVRTLAEFELPRIVVVSGEVRHPGSYTLRGRDERLRDVILDRAGGLSASAYAAGFQLTRDSSLVNVDLVAVLKDPSNPDNLVLMPGDHLYVPEYNPVVVVRGAVNNPSSVMYKPGEDLDYYIASAGGYARNADEDRANVRYLSGQSGTVKRHLLLFSSKPPIEPGAVVTVPLVPVDDRRDWSKVVSESVQVMASLATVALVVARLK